MRPLLGIASIALACLCPASARAGLVFEIDGFDGRKIEGAEVSADRVTVTSRGHTYTIEVPDGAGASLLAWARSDRGGPLVFSIDGSMVPPENNNYHPPSVPPELGSLLFEYDRYAHAIACGATPRRSAEPHPLAQSAGEKMLPYRAHAALLDPAVRTPEAYSYRRLTERFAAPLGCIGELSLYVVPGSPGRLVSIQPRSWIHMRGSQWYRSIDVPSEADAWGARLPYQALKQDLESRWPAYRATFRSLDSLSSIVEAMAVLRAIKRDAPSVWRKLERVDLPRQLAIYDEIEQPISHRLDAGSWRQLSRAWLGDHIDTPAQANLLLGLALTDVQDLPFDGLDAVAGRDPVTGAKFQLASLVFNAGTGGFAEKSRRLLESLSRDPHRFRLRATALFAIEAVAERQELSWEEHSELARLLARQRDALADDFLQRAKSACAAGPTDLATWENLSQDVYSVGLLRHLRRDGQLSPQLVAAVACIHFHRGMAPQQGRQFAFRHAHYRFLGYLARKTHDPQLKSQIIQYRRKLAAAMKLRDWELEQEVQS